MNKTVVEKNIAIVLFVLVLITFSFAEKDTKKLEKLYNPAASATGAVTMQPVQHLHTAGTFFSFPGASAPLPYSVLFILPVY